MTNLALDLRREPPGAFLSGRADGDAAAPGAARVPAVTIHAFCETPETAEGLARAAADRRMARARVTVLPGGARAAIERYRGSPTPNLILLESRADGPALLAALDALAAVCDAGTRLVVIGVANDIELYRALVRRGVSEYLRAPVEPPALVSAIAGLFGDPGASKLGRAYAFIGARGGSGSSTLAHNVAWTLGRLSESDVLLIDMDLAFGTASLDFDVEPEAGIAEALREPGRLDDQLLERLLTRCGEHLGLLAAPALLGPPGEFAGDADPDAFQAVLELAQASVPHVVLDLPHAWSASTRRMLLAADEVVITATPDLASLRNARNLVDLLRQARPNDPEPRLVLNQVGMPKRPEIRPAEFAEVLELAPLVSLPFDAQAFGGAANGGRMLAEGRRGGALAAPLRRIAEALSGRSLARRRRFGGLARFFARGTSRRPARPGR